MPRVAWIEDVALFTWNDTIGLSSGTVFTDAMSQSEYVLLSYGMPFLVDTMATQADTYAFKAITPESLSDQLTLSDVVQAQLFSTVIESFSDLRTTGTIHHLSTRQALESFWK